MLAPSYKTFSIRLSLNFFSESIPNVHVFLQSKATWQKLFYR